MNADAATLLNEGWLDESDFAGLADNEIAPLAKRTLERIRDVDKAQRITPEEMRQVKQLSAKAAKLAAREVRNGYVSGWDLAGRVDVNLLRLNASIKPKRRPTFDMAVKQDVYVKQTAGYIGKMLIDDAVSKRLKTICDALPQVTAPTEQEAIETLEWELENLQGRVEVWRKQLAREKSASRYAYQEL